MVSLVALLVLLVVPMAGASDGSDVPEVVSDSIEGLEEPGGGLDAAADGVGRTSEPTEAPIAFSMLGFEMPADADVWFRVSSDGDDWTEWDQALPLDRGDGPDPESDEADALDSDRAVTDAIWVREASWVQVGVVDGEPEDVTVHLVDAHGLSQTTTERLRLYFKSLLSWEPRTAQASGGEPQVVSRAQWGADEENSGSPSYAPVHGGIVHHTATSNSYSRSEAPGLVRGFQRYHIQSNGWKDIGYNVLVDRYGTIYEGRAGGLHRGVIGAHAAGFNTGTFGVSVIGNFDQGQPTQASLDALEQVIGWKSGIHGLDPQSTTTFTSRGSNKYSSGTKVDLPTIFAHRDVGRTACPGGALYSKMSSVRAGGADAVPEEIPEVRITEPRAGATLTGDATFEATAESTDSTIEYVVFFVDGQWVGNAYDAPYEVFWPSGMFWNGTKEISAVAVDSKDRRITERVRVEVANDEPPHKRLAGPTGRATAAAISQAAIADGEAERAVVARDDIHADAITGGPLAGADGPLLLTHPDRLDYGVRAELERTLPSGRTVYVLGGSNAISDEVVEALEDDWEVERLAGANREETAAEVARIVVDRTGQSTALVARSAMGEGEWADGLAAGAYGAKHGTPVLLTRSDSLPEATAKAIEELSISDTVVLGGQVAVSDAVEADLPSPTRIAGSDRAETAVEIAKQLWGEDGKAVLIAEGYRPNGWKDALAAAPLAARYDAPVFLVNQDVPSVTSDRFIDLRRHNGGPLTAWILGGTSAISYDTSDAALRYLR